MLRVMRAYKFLNADYGLKSLRERRLKQSRIHDLNDLFESRPYDITDPALRGAVLQTRSQINESRGVLCFSADWNDPVIWAHYSEKHAGLCLGFEIPSIMGDVENDESGYVKYISDPPYFPPSFLEWEIKRGLKLSERFSIQSSSAGSTNTRYACGTFAA